MVNVLQYWPGSGTRFKIAAPAFDAETVRALVGEMPAAKAAKDIVVRSVAPTVFDVTIIHAGSERIGGADVVADTFLVIKDEA